MDALDRVDAGTEELNLASHLPLRELTHNFRQKVPSALDHAEQKALSSDGQQHSLFASRIGVLNQNRRTRPRGGRAMPRRVWVIAGLLMSNQSRMRNTISLRRIQRPWSVPAERISQRIAACLRVRSPRIASSIAILLR